MHTYFKEAFIYSLVVVIWFEELKLDALQNNICCHDDWSYNIMQTCLVRYLYADISNAHILHHAYFNSVDT